MNIRSKEWIEFAVIVDDHINNYTVKQYGDRGSDLATNYTPEDFVKQIKKYCERHGKNARPGQDKIDMIKIAHYAQMAWSKLP
jgi:hypothetical protein